MAYKKENIQQLTPAKVSIWTYSSDEDDVTVAGYFNDLIIDGFNINIGDIILTDTAFYRVTDVDKTDPIKENWTVTITFII
jgi:hypothetical protein